MKLRLASLTLISFFSVFFFSCTKGIHDNTSAFYDDGRKKPLVAFVPVVDNSNAKVGWDLSDEFTGHLMQKLGNNSQFRLSTLDEMSSLITGLSEKQDPFSPNFQWVKQTFSKYEFVVFSELVEHDVQSKPLRGNFLDYITPSSEIVLTLRLRIFDLRGAIPKVILQELVHNKHTISNPGDLEAKGKDYWKKVTFQITPLGIAHSQLIKTAVTRIEDYIKISQSH
ncbi:hypothetical protein COB21_00285 [Candidatus Aerophobetes bacterium]|uniref:Lipoprotein n=1 Tax=Aerophobetes bacterium TaxID=2030807 RepID=A0A2A4X7R5_UNCAE|nr:MAG: hypothetical protein COB21_00285 [Candidatus Aerophobetes bacterium]